MPQQRPHHTDGSESTMPPDAGTTADGPSIAASASPAAASAAASASASAAAKTTTAVPATVAFPGAHFGAATQLTSPRIAWTMQVSGPFFTSLAAVREAMQQHGPSKPSEWKAKWTNQQAGVAIDQRQPYRSPVVVAVTSTLAWLLGRYQRMTTAVRQSNHAGGESALAAVVAYTNQLQQLNAGALVQLGQLLLRHLDGVCHRCLAGGRELMPLMFAHQEAALLTQAFRTATTVFTPSRDAQGQLTTSHSASEVSQLVLLMSGATAKIRRAVGIAVERWCDQSWPELMKSDDLIRKYMPQALTPLSICPISSQLAGGSPICGEFGTTAGGGSPSAASPLQWSASSPSASPQPAYSHVGSPNPNSSPSTKTHQSPSLPSSSSSSKRKVDTRPTALLPMVEDYLLPCLGASLAASPAVSASQLLSTALSSILTSFLRFLLHHQLASRLNGQGAARLNVELKWLHQWMKLDQLAPGEGKRVPMEPMAPSPAASTIPPTWPAASSLFLTRCDLPADSPLLPSESTRSVYARAFQRLDVWSRCSAIVRVLLQPDGYRVHRRGVPPPGEKTKAVRLQSSADQIEVLTWTVPQEAMSGGVGIALASVEPTLGGSHRSGAPAAAFASNRVAPLPIPLAVTSPTSNGGSLASIASSPHTTHADIRGAALPDLEQCLTLVVSTHASTFVAAGAARCTIVDWP